MKDTSKMNMPMREKVSPQAKIILDHMVRARGISAQDAMNDHQIAAHSLSRRITELRRAGVVIKSMRKVNPITKRPYVRYVLGAA